MRAAEPEQVARALRAVTVWPPDLEPDDRYVGLDDLIAGGLAGRIRDRLGGPPLRVADSAVVMGVASRLWSVLLVPACRDRVLPDTDSLVARDQDGALVLALRRVTGRRDPSANDLDAAVHRVLDPVLAGMPLSRRLLWGNVAATLHAVPRVHALPQARELVAALLARAPYAGELDELPSGAARRRTCCLFYLVPGAPLCGDCVLDHPPRRAGRQP